MTVTLVFLPINLISRISSRMCAQYNRYRPVRSSSSSSLRRCNCCRSTSPRQNTIQPGSIVRGTWKVIRYLNGGGYGSVFLVKDLRDNTFVVMKTEQRIENPYLHVEFAVQESLKSRGITTGMAQALDYGRWGAYSVLVMPRLWKSLSDLRREYNLSKKTVFMIGIQLIKRLKALHDVGYIHYDIKPGNVMVGYEDRNRIYLIDYGMCQRFLHLNGRHVSAGPLPFRGTPFFASVSAMKGLRCSRRDDLESIGYTLMELLDYDHMWESHESLSSRREFRYIRTKKDYMKESRAGFQDRVMTKYFRYVWDLRFEEEPDYAFLQRLFVKSLRRRGLSNDSNFDWN